MGICMDNGEESGSYHLDLGAIVENPNGKSKGKWHGCYEFQGYMGII